MNRNDLGDSLEIRRIFIDLLFLIDQEKPLEFGMCYWIVAFEVLEDQVYGLLELAGVFEAFRALMRELVVQLLLEEVLGHRGSPIHRWYHYS